MPVLTMVLMEYLMATILKLLVTKTVQIQQAKYQMIQFCKYKTKATNYFPSKEQNKSVL